MSILLAAVPTPIPSLPSGPSHAAFGSDIDILGFHLNLIILLLITVITSTPLVLAALGGIVCERSGVVNIGLEGMMLMSSFFGYVAAFVTNNLFFGVVVAVVGGALVALLHAVLSIHFRVDQIISGTVINILALGVTGFFYRGYLQAVDRPGPGTLPHWNIPLLQDLPLLGPVLFRSQPVTYAALALVPVLFILLFHTRWGLRTRAIGEHPRAADTAGINVNRLRYWNVGWSGVLAGLGGAYFSLQSIGTFEPNITGGRGFIALAAMIFGKWHPVGAFFAALMFGMADALAAELQAGGVRVPHQLLGMLPYVLTIVVLAGAIGRATPPGAVGKPYVK
jgi:simple sugar transport system permease protein